MPNCSCSGMHQTTTDLKLNLSYICFDGDCFYLAHWLRRVLSHINGAVTYKRIKVTDAEWTENLQNMFIR